MCIFGAVFLAGLLASGVTSVHGTFAGEVYMDVGTLGGYHAAQDYLRGKMGHAYKLPQIA